jgi:ABC-type microcin C transport system duplicated ATPase subunit YejF
MSSDTANHDLLIDVKNLSVAFTASGTTEEVVHGVNFDIRRGETVALVGESGSGKTVSALSIMGLLPQSASHPSGEILYQKQDILKLSERELRGLRGDQISMIFQEPMSSLNPLHSIEKQVGEVLQLHRGMEGSALHRRVIELLERVGIRDAEAIEHPRQNIPAVIICAKPMEITQSAMPVLVAAIKHFTKVALLKGPPRGRGCRRRYKVINR